MSEYTGMITERELARVRHTELLEEAAELRADRNQGGARLGKAPWLAVSLIGLVLVASAAWLLILG